jgi:hypothetical protein
VPELIQGAFDLDLSVRRSAASSPISSGSEAAGNSTEDEVRG